jgi:SAM-dependent methyltransferase
VCDPWLDYESIYDQNYYSGRGADALVDYIYEADYPNQTIRQYEWRGILCAVSKLFPIDHATRWLDYGCGVGGLVQFLHRQGYHSAVGFEQGWSVARLTERELPHLVSTDLPDQSGTFDVVTAVEVLEHAVDPVRELRRIRDLLRPGGLLFATTGNSVPFRDRLSDWGYVVPDVHISFFEPATLETALRRAGFQPAFPGFGPGWDDIIRFKVLKTLGRKRVSLLERTMPWHLVSRLVDRRFGVSAQPVGWACP